MLRVLAHSGNRDLMRAECALDRHAVHFFWTSPTFWGAQDDHGPRRPGLVFLFVWIAPKLLLDLPYAREAVIECGSEELMHAFGIVSFYKVRGVALPFVERRKFFVTGATHDCRAGEFVAIQVQDGQHGSVPRRIQKLDALPASFKRAGFGFAIADHASHNQVGIVESRPKGMYQGITQFAAFMHRVRGMRAAVAGDAAGSRKRAKKKTHAVDVLRNLRMDVGISPFQVGTGVERWPSVARA